MTPAITSGLPALPMPAMRPPLMPTSALQMPVQSTMSALVMTQSSASLVGDAGGLAHAVAQHLAAAELALVAVDGGVALRPRRRGRCRRGGRGRRSSGRRCRRSGAGRCGGSWHVLRQRPRRSRFGSTRSTARREALPPRITRAPAIATSVTVLVSPGSKRTAVPAGMSRRMP